MARRSLANSQPCSVPNCDREIVAHGWCDGHYSRWRRLGDIQVDIPLKVYDKDRDFYIDRDGYRYIKRPGHPNVASNGWGFEHRIAMADHIGRPLLDEETVHHLNGDRADNRIENLELWASPHRRGQRVDDLVADAVALLRRYAPELLVEDQYACA